MLKNKTLTISNLETGESSSQIIGDDGKLKIGINQPASFKFLKYSYK